MIPSVSISNFKMCCPIGLKSFVIMLLLSVVGINTAPVRTQSEAQMYLSQFGYLPSNSGGLQMLDENTMFQAIQDFQEFAGLDVNGELDSGTLEKMSLSRCGVKDKSANSRSKRGFGTPWRKKDLTYRITIYTRKMDPADIDAEIARAFNVWSEYTDLTFTHKRNGPVDIEILFARGKHDGCDGPFDGRGRTLAHAYSPPDGNAHFDDAEIWTLNSYEGTNLFEVAAHEFGHSLGLAHSKGSTTALMAAFYTGFKPNFRLHSEDIMRIQELYGKKTEQEKDAEEEEDEDNSNNGYGFGRPTSRQNPTVPTSRDNDENPGWPTTRNNGLSPVRPTTRRRNDENPGWPTTRDNDENPGWPTTRNNGLNPVRPTSRRRNDDNPGWPTTRDNDENPGWPTTRNNDLNPVRPTSRRRNDENPGWPTTRDNDENPGWPTTRNNGLNPVRPTSRRRNDENPGWPTTRDSDENPGWPTSRRNDENPGWPTTRDNDENPSWPTTRNNGLNPVRPTSRRRNDENPGWPTTRDNDQNSGWPTSRRNDQNSGWPSTRRNDQNTGWPTSRRNNQNSGWATSHHNDENTEEKEEDSKVDTRGQNNNNCEEDNDEYLLAGGSRSPNSCSYRRNPLPIRRRSKNIWNTGGSDDMY